MHREKISAIVITRNEAMHIRRCLDSLRWADEIVVVDQSSSDETVAICREYTDQVFVVPAKGFCEPDRITACEKAAHSWIIYLDADEYMSDALRREIETLLCQAPAHDAYYLPRRNMFLGKWIRGSGWYPGYVLRLFRKNAVRLPTRLHEDITARAPAGFLHNPIDHVTATDLQDYLEKVNRYTSLLARQADAGGVQITWCNCCTRMFLLPLAYALQKFFLKRGFRDGYHGLLIACLTWLTVFLNAVKLWEIQRQKVRVLVVFHSSGSTGPNRSSFPVLACMDRRQFAVTVACPPQGPLVQRLKSAGIGRVTLDFQRCNQICLFVRLVWIIWSRRIAVLHGHMGRVGPLIAAAGAFCRVPAVILHEHMHGADHFWLENRPVQRWAHILGHRLMCRWIDRVIAVSAHARESYIQRQGFDPQRVVVIANGVDCSDRERLTPDDRRALRVRLGFEPDALLVGAAGRLIREKGYADLVAAAARIREAAPQARFVIAGDGDQREVLQSLAEDLGLNGVMRFTGLVDEIDPLIAGLDVLVQPSHSECRESFGNVVIEALSRRVAVAVSDTESFRSFIDDGVTGMFFREKDPADLAEKVIRLLKDQDLNRRIGDRGYALCLQKFDACRSSRLLEDCYLSVLRGKGRQP